MFIYVDDVQRDVPSEECQICAALMMLPLYFGEQDSLLYKGYEETATFAEFVADQHTPTPYLAYAGENPFAAKTVGVVVEGNVIEVDGIYNGLLATFMTYYVLKICFPVEVRNTMEFIQRVFFEIKPVRGTKVRGKAKAGRKYSHSVKNSVNFKTIAGEFKSFGSIANNCYCARFLTRLPGLLSKRCTTIT